MTDKNYLEFLNSKIKLSQYHGFDVYKSSSQGGRFIFADLLKYPSLGHSDMKTTLNYFAGFDDEAKKELAVSMMNF